MPPEVSAASSRAVVEPVLASFPLHPIVRDADGAPRCGCTSGPACPTIGKHPAFPYSELEAGEQIAPLEGGGIGIATGERSGIFVVDLDVRPAEGKDGIAALRALVPNIPRTLTVETPTGGLHLYFRNPDGLRVKTMGGLVRKDSGIDIRGEGGFVVGPGSRHKNGGIYLQVKEEGDEIAEAPPELLALLPSARTPTSETTHAVVDPASPEGARRVAYARDMIARMPASTEGAGGSNALLRACIRLVCLELPLTTCEELAAELKASPPWSPEEIRHKVASADRSERTRVRGFPSEGFFERLTATPSRVAPEMTDDPNRSRRTHTPLHTYSYALGARSLNGSGPNKMSFGDLLSDLYTHAAWDGVLAFDELRGCVVAVDPPVQLDAEDPAVGLSDVDVTRVRGWFEYQGKTIKKESFFDALNGVAKRRAFHPVREYLEGLGAPDPEDHEALSSFARIVLGNDGEKEAEMIRKTLVAAVRRVLSPGCQVDTVLVLAGPQGARKSRLISTLFGKDWTKSQLADVNNKDACAELKTAWAIEMAELANVRRAADRETLKAFLTRDTDTYHARYSRLETRSPRSSIFIGTTNAVTFLNDATGDRRYWPMKVTGRIDLAWVREHRDGLWAAAYELACDPTYEHWFDDAAGELDALREAFKEVDPWHEPIRKYLTGRTFVQRDDVYTGAIDRSEHAVRNAGKREMDRVVEVLQALGCVEGRTPRTKDGKRDRGWKVPNALATETPPADELRRRAASGVAEKVARLATN